MVNFPAGLPKCLKSKCLKWLQWFIIIIIIIIIIIVIIIVITSKGSCRRLKTTILEQNILSNRQIINRKRPPF